MPANPASAEPMANAKILNLFGSIPETSAANSSAFIAKEARPDHERLNA